MTENALKIAILRTGIAITEGQFDASTPEWKIVVGYILSHLLTNEGCDRYELQRMIHFNDRVYDCTLEWAVSQLIIDDVITLPHWPGCPAPTNSEPMELVR